MGFSKGKKTAAALLAAACFAAALAGCSGSKPEEGVSDASQPASEAVSETVSTPAVEEEWEVDYGLGLAEGGWFEGVTALDYVTLPDYRNMEIPADVTAISDSDIQTELENRMSDFASAEQITNRVVVDGDTVNIDYVGSIDGVEFEGGSTGGAGTTVIIGVTSYIDDFLEQLIGHMPGDTFDVNVTFPEPYPNNPDLSGKDAVFVTTINYIESTVEPELTDSFVLENWKDTMGWSTVDEARSGVEEILRTDAVTNYLWDQIMEQVEVSEVPDAVIEYQVTTMKNYYASSAKRYGMTFSEFLDQAIGVESVAQLVEESRESLESNARSALIWQALCEDMELNVSDEDIAEFFRTNLHVDDYSDYEEEYGKEYLALLAREDLAKRRLGERR